MGHNADGARRRTAVQHDAARRCEVGVMSASLAVPLTASQRGGWRLRALRPAGGAGPHVLLSRLCRRLRHHPGPWSRALLPPAPARRRRPRARGRNRPSAGTSAGSHLHEPDGTKELTLAVDGLQCGACVWLIESGAGEGTRRSGGPRQHDDPPAAAGLARLGSKTRTAWSGGSRRWATAWCRSMCRPWPAAQDRTGRMLLRSLAVAGFAAGNVMLISIGIWAGQTRRCRPYRAGDARVCCTGSRR